jgi:hypothetical protein
MEIQPIAQNGQVQSLTTALKNLTKEYPGGGGTLRELLQNADDAGATEVVWSSVLSLKPKLLTGNSDSFSITELIQLRTSFIRNWRNIKAPHF